MAVMAVETMGFSTSQPVSSHGCIEPGGSNGSNQIVQSAYPKQFFIAGGSIVMVVPQKCLAVGCFHGKSQAEMDDLGVPPWIGNLRRSYHNYLWGG